jgi:hypothetical protein
MEVGVGGCNRSRTMSPTCERPQNRAPEGWLASDAPHIERGERAAYCKLLSPLRRAGTPHASFDGARVKRTLLSWHRKRRAAPLRSCETNRFLSAINPRKEQGLGGGWWVGPPPSSLRLAPLLTRVSECSTSAVRKQSACEDPHRSGCVL